jgi:hypothetical protein
MRWQIQITSSMRNTDDYLFMYFIFTIYDCWTVRSEFDRVSRVARLFCRQRRALWLLSVRTAAVAGPRLRI